MHNKLKNKSLIGKKSNGNLLNQLGGLNDSFGAQLAILCGGKNLDKGEYNIKEFLKEEELIIQFATTMTNNLILSNNGTVYTWQRNNLIQTLENEMRMTIVNAITNSDSETIKSIYCSNIYTVQPTEEILIQKEQSYTAIQLCCKLGKCGVLSQFFKIYKNEYNNDIKHMTNVLAIKNQKGKTALMLAALNNQTACTEIIFRIYENAKDTDHLRFLFQQTDLQGKNCLDQMESYNEDCYRLILGKQKELGMYVQESWGSSTDFIPVQIQSILEPIVKISAGSNHVLALDIQGNVWTWGDNYYGQLGRGERKNSYVPARISSLDKQFVVQIYAYQNLSFAVTSRGLTQSWGDNGNFQLGITGQYQEEPKILNNDVWEDITDHEQRIVYGKDNSGVYLKEFTHPSYNKQSLNQKGSMRSALDQDKKEERKTKGKRNQSDCLNDLKYTYNDLVSRREMLDSQILTVQNQMYGEEKSEELKLGYEREQQIVNYIDNLLEELYNEKYSLESSKKKTENEIKAIDKELDSLKSSLVDIQQKEQNLLGQQTDLKEKMRNLQRIQSQNDQNLLDDQGSEEQGQKRKKKQNSEEEIQKKKDGYTRQLKTIKEILAANENVKNTVIKRQNLSEEKLQQNQEKLKEISQKIESIIKKQQVYKTIMEDKKVNQKIYQMDHNKQYLEKMISKYNTYSKHLDEATLKTMAKKTPDKFDGLEQMIEESSRQINMIQKELAQHKVYEKDPSYEIVTKYISVLNDNISIRLQVNNQQQGICTQATNKYEEMLEKYQDQYPNNQVIEHIEQRNYQQYLKSLQKVIKVPQHILVNNYKMLQENQHILGDTPITDSEEQEAERKNKKKNRGKFCC